MGAKLKIIREFLMLLPLLPVAVSAVIKTFKIIKESIWKR